jgi:ArsR family transcriptional regulator, arsenate/arsenite/antimonite-responsive transcriptional repressor
VCQTRGVTTLAKKLRLQAADFAACCGPVTGGVLDVDAAESLARIFRALGDPTRVRLLSLIAAHSDGEACVCDLTDPVGLSQPTVSHHLKQLVEAGLIKREQRGRWAYYRVVPTALDALADTLRQQPAT